MTSVPEMETTIVSYLSRGFTVTSRMPHEAVLLKKKAFSIPMLVIGFLLCLIPLVIYLFVYAMQKDQVVVIRLVTESSTTLEPASTISPEKLGWSQNRRSWWNGTEWVDVSAELPPGASLSDDKRQWWDGEAWRVVQPGTRHPGLSGH